jgi:hypothetical protein
MSYESTSDCAGFVLELPPGASQEEQKARREHCCLCWFALVPAMARIYTSNERVRLDFSRVKSRKLSPVAAPMIQREPLGRRTMLETSSAAEQFHRKTLRTNGANNSFLCFEEFYARVRKCQDSFDELEERTNRQFVLYVLQECWGFWMDRRLDNAIQDASKRWEQNRQRAVKWYCNMKELLQQCHDEALAKDMLEMLEAGTLPAFKAPSTRAKRGRPPRSEKGTSDPTILATKLAERARSETGSPHWRLFAEILYALFPSDFPNTDKENLPHRVKDFAKRRASK